jgi:hypothetical protein
VYLGPLPSRRHRSNILVYVIAFVLTSFIARLSLNLVGQTRAAVCEQSPRMG